MNYIQCLPLKSCKFVRQYLKSFYAITSQMSTSSSLAQLQCKNAKFLLLPEHYNTVQKIQIRGSRYFRRRPIEVLENIKGQYMVDYVSEQEHQAGELHNDETEMPVQHNVEESLADEEEIPKTEKRKKKRKEKKKKNLEDEESENFEDEEKQNLVFKNLNIHFYHKTIPKLRRYLEEGKSSYVREDLDFFYVEGWRLFAESLNKGLVPLAVYFSRSRIFYNLIPTVAQTKEELVSKLNLYPLIKTPYSVFKLWSTLKTPPGIIGVFKLSDAEKISRLSAKENNEHSFPLTVILDEIRDPSNLGGIFRTLVAAGVHQIILMKGCCDIWDPKVFRATAGTQLHMNCLSKVPWSLLESHLPPSPAVFLADSYCSREFREEYKDEMENIEPADDDETASLKQDGLRESELTTVAETSEEGYELTVNYSHDDPEHLDQFRNVDFPKVFYEHADFFNEKISLNGQNAVLIIGGERGLSNNAKKLALELDAVQVGIPMLNNVESLNSSVVTGILVYAAQRQYNIAKRKQEVQFNVEA